MEVENIRLFLGTCSLEELCILKAHIESGKFSFNSCDCLAGFRTAPHPLRGAMYGFNLEPHLQEGRKLPYAVEAENELWALGIYAGGAYGGDPLIRERLLPLVVEEIAFRDRLAEKVQATEVTVG